MRQQPSRLALGSGCPSYGKPACLEQRKEDEKQSRLYCVGADSRRPLRFFSYRPAIELWNEFRVRGLQKAAAEFEEHGNIEAAMKSLGRALRLKPDNLLSVRMAVTVWTGKDPRQERLWRDRLNELAPNDIPNRAALARLALDAGDAESAMNHLEAIQEVIGDEPKLLNMRATAWVLKGRWDLAIADAEAALAAQPESNELKLALARLLIAPKIRGDHPRGVRLLQEVELDPRFQPEVRRLFRDEAIREQNWSEARRRSEQLVGSSLRPARDQIIHLLILERTDSEAAANWKRHLEAAAVNDAEISQSLLLYYQSQGKWEAMTDWLREKVDSGNAASFEEIALLNVLDERGLYAELVERFSKKHLGENEFLRLALLARAERKSGPSTSSRWQADWSEAVQLAWQSEKTAFALAKRVVRWRGWEDEGRRLLERLWQRFPQRTADIAGLMEQVEREAGNTAGLLALYERLQALRPNSTIVCNNRIYFELLLRPSEKLHQEIESLAGEYPKDLVIQSTLMLSRFQRGRLEEVLHFFEGISHHSFSRESSVAALWVAALRKNGKISEAAKRSETIDLRRLLPEEVSLLGRSDSP